MKKIVYLAVPTLLFAALSLGQGFSYAPPASAALTQASYTSSAASGASAFVMADGARLCLNATCTHRLQGDGAGTAIDLYFNNSVTVEQTSTTHYVLTAARIRGAMSNDTAGAALTVSDAEGLLISRTSLATCSSTLEGTLQSDILSGAATGKITKLCYCSSNGSSTYTWRNLMTGTNGTSTTCGTE